MLRSTFASDNVKAQTNEGRADEHDDADTAGPEEMNARLTQKHKEKEKNTKRKKKGDKKEKQRRPAPPGLWEQVTTAVGVGPDPDNSHWINLETHDSASSKVVVTGQVLLSIDILPKTICDMQPAGFGRSEPNSNPVLPERVGRMDWTKMYLARSSPTYCMQQDI